MIDKYEDPRLQEIEDMVIRKIKKCPKLEEKEKIELIEEIKIEGIEEFMNFVHLENNEWVENVELKNKVFSSIYQKRKLVNDYINTLTE